MSRYKYGWTKRYGVSAQVVGEIVERFPTRTAENLVKEARRRSSPLHKLFEWNNSAAAEQYRLIQARVMVASLRVEVVDARGAVHHVNAFVSKANRTGDFSPVLEADADDLTAAEQACWRHMQTFRARWKGLEFARVVVLAIDGVTRSAQRRAKKKPRTRKRK